MSFLPTRRVPHRTLRTGLAAALALSLLALTPGAGHASPDAAFTEALADLKQARADAGSVISTAKLVEMHETFLSRFDLATLGPREFADIVRLNALAYGEAARTPERAQAAVARLEPLAAATDAEGALAAALLVRLSGPAGLGPRRAGWEAAALQHPGFVSLLQSEFGDIALDLACRTAPRDEAARSLLLGLAEKLDATKSTAPAGKITLYWDRIVGFVPEGEHRQAIRRQLVDYLTAALARLADADAHTSLREQIENQLTLLNGIEARGLLFGRPAPELNFTWSSHDKWKSLADLRGKVVVLDFWATWCGQCVAAFPEVARVAERYRGLDVEIVGVTSVQGKVIGLGPKAIDCQGDPEKEMRLMTDYIRAKGLTWPIVFSREPAINPDYGLDGLPGVVVIAPDGTVRHKFSGYHGEKLVKAIDAVLAEFRRRTPAPAE